MNIVKLKDILMPSECSFSKLFNEKLKGKYAYWIQMRYIFPLDSMDYMTYIKYEQFDEIDFLKVNVLPHIDLYSEDCCMYDFTQQYIDCEATDFENITRINKYIIANNYATDHDIDILKIRRFRSWLASEILTLNTCPDGTYLNTLNENQIHMLEFYKNDMYNEVVKQLSVFGKENIFNISTEIGCICCNSVNISGIKYNNNTCDALDIYIKNVHTLMVNTFKDVNFWLTMDKDFIITFKQYIDNIIKAGLVIANSEDTVLYNTCKCNNNTEVTTVILRTLSDALQYIIEDNVTMHFNFIHDALYNWAEQLYDKMSWNIK